jgi:hypothetical protein
MKTRYVLLAIALSVQTAGAQQGHDNRPQPSQGLRAEHDEIEFALEKAMKEPGAVGRAARELNALLSPHFQREVSIALPPLWLVPRLVEDRDVSGLQGWLLPMTDSLNAVLPRMLEEHKAIGAARAKLAVAARRAGNHSVVEFTQKLAAHAEAEEELFYPMAVLVGEVVRSRMIREHALAR